MKRFFIAGLAVLLSVCVDAQDFSFQLNKYEFDPAALTAPMMDSTGYHTCTHWIRTYVDIHDEGKLGTLRYRLVHTLRQVNDVGAVEQYNKLYLPVYPNQSSVNIRARVIQNGEVVYTADQDDIKIVEEEGVQYQILALEKVAIGCYIESIIGTNTSLELEGTEYMQFGSPVKDMIVCLVGPKVLHYKTKVYNNPTSARDTVIDERRFNYVRLSNVKAMEDEEYCMVGQHLVRMEYTMESIEGSATGVQWADMGRGFYENHFSGYKDLESSIKKFLKEIKLDSKKNDAEKIFAIEDYLKRNISIERGVQGETINTAFKNKYISPYGINRLYMFAFFQAGIPYEVVGTCERGTKVFDRTFESNEFFQNIIFYMPSVDSYLDPQNVTVRFPVISSDFLGQDAFRVKGVELGGQISPVTTLKKIPMNKLENSIMLEKFNVGFSSDLSSTTTKYFKSYSGFAHSGLRALCYYASAEDRDKALESIIKGSHENSKVENIEVKNSDLAIKEQADAPLETSATITGSDLLEFAGDKVIFKIGEVIGQQSELYETKPRVNPIDIDFAHEYRRTLDVEIPSGHTFKGLEALKMNIESKDESGKMLAFFTSDYKMDGNKLMVTITESYPELSVPLKYYDTFSAVINAAADFNKVLLVIE